MPRTGRPPGDNTLRAELAARLEDLLDLPFNATPASGTARRKVFLNTDRVRPHQDPLARKLSDIEWDVSKLSNVLTRSKSGHIRFHELKGEWLVSMSLEDFAHLVNLLSVSL